MILSVASGKGGTGKTTIALAIASYLNTRGASVSILDCDVEEPNINLFLKSEIKVKETIYVPIPSVNNDRCNGCGNCGDICQFNSIVMIGDTPQTYPDMCHSCGGCVLACPNDAITEIGKEIGIVEEGYSDKIRYIGGRLKVGEPISPPLIKAVKNHISNKNGNINIIDAPPGTSCPVIESVRESDYAILITEPTPFGLNDLSLSVDMIRELCIPFGIVINRSDIGDNRTLDYCNRENIDIIASIPNSLELAKKYSTGEFVNFFIDNFESDLINVITRAHIRYK